MILRLKIDNAVKKQIKFLYKWLSKSEFYGEGKIVNGISVK
jgi:hypothetical protein